jgi:hypothetical protein
MRDRQQQHRKSAQHFHRSSSVASFCPQDGRVPVKAPERSATRSRGMLLTIKVEFLLALAPGNGRRRSHRQNVTSS